MIIIKDDKRNLCGKHLKYIRNYLGLTQSEFAELLFNYGITEKKGKSIGAAKNEKTIASWERGRTQLPKKVMRVIQDNILFENQKINWSYLNGDSEYITNSTDSIIRNTFDMIENTNWVLASPEKINEIANSNLDQFGSILFEYIMPLFKYSSSDIFDAVRFNKYVYNEIKKIIDDYVKNEKEGR